jgi:hypothetical protein
MDEQADGPPSAAEALDIIDRAQARTGAGLTPDLALLFGVWGAAYMVAGVLWYLARVDVLSGAAAVVAGALVGAAAIAISIVAGVRSTRGVRSASDAPAAMHGFSWLVTLALTVALAVGIGLGQPPATRDVLVPVLFVFVVGVLCTSSGTLWRSVPLYVTGGWIMLVGAAAAFVPAPAHLLVLAVGAGGGFVALAGWFAVRGPGR